MLISDLMSQYYSNQTNGQGKKVNDSTGTRAVQKLVSSLRDMGAGTIFEGTINGMEGGKVTIGLSNGQQITARLDANISLTQGQSMFFQVKTNDGAQIAIRPFMVDGSSVNPTLMSALSAARLPATGENLSMVNTMMEEQMPIDAASLSQMARIMNANPDINVQTLVQMHKFGLPINPEMAAQFENYMDDRQAIGKAMESFMDELPQVMADENMSAAELKQMNREVLSIITEGLTEAAAAGETAAVRAVSTDSQPLLAQAAVEGAFVTGEEPDQALENFNTTGRETVQNPEQDGSRPLPGTEQVSQEAAAHTELLSGEGMQMSVQGEQAAQGTQGAQRMPSADLQAAGEAVQADPSAAQTEDGGPAVQSNPSAAQIVPEDPSARTFAAESQTAQGTPGAENAVAGENTAQSAAPQGAGSTAAQSDPAAQAAGGGPDAPGNVREHAIGNLLDRTQLASLGEQLRAIPGLTENSNVFKNGRLDPNVNSADVLRAVKEALGQESTPGRQSLTRLFGGREFAALMKDSLEQQWMVRPKDVAREGSKISSLYDKLEDQISRMEQVVRTTGHEHAEFSQAAAEVRSNVDFMNHLNEAYTYVQIPLKMSGQNASGELFVYTNKKNLAQKGDKELTAFLHLDLDNLGSTDVSVRLKNKDVSTDFYLEDDASYALVAAHLPQLEERLNRLGYHCTINVTNENRKVNFVEDFLKKDQPSAGHMLHRYSFDMRA